MNDTRVTRRTAFRGMAAGLAVPFVFRAHARPRPARRSTTPASGPRAWPGPTSARSRPASMSSSSPSPTSTSEPHGRVKKRFPDVKVYQDWRELLDKEKNLNSVNVSTPDHMHAPITMRAMQQGLHVYTQKPLTQTIYEARQLTRVARREEARHADGHPDPLARVHRTVVATIQAGAIGKVKEVHSWSGKHWGDRKPAARPHGPGPGRPELGLLARRGRRAAVHRRLLSPRRLAQAARLRHRHLRRHGLPHPRPGLHVAGPDRPEVGPLRRRRAQRR